MNNLGIRFIRATFDDIFFFLLVDFGLSGWILGIIIFTSCNESLEWPSCSIAEQNVLDLQNSSALDTGQYFKKG